MENLRRYRIKLDSFKEFLNDTGKGIALFDLIISFLTAYIL